MIYNIIVLYLIRCNFRDVIIYVEITYLYILYIDIELLTHSHRNTNNTEFLKNYCQITLLTRLNLLFMCANFKLISSNISLSLWFQTLNVSR